MLKFRVDISDESFLKMRHLIEEKWLKKKDMTIERAKGVSKFAYKFMFWLDCQIKLSKMKQDVSPMENEIQTLTFKNELKQAKVKKLKKQIRSNKKDIENSRKQITQIVTAVNIFRDEIENLELLTLDYSVYSTYSETGR